MDAIKDPTLRERIERSIIKPIISTKAKFGLGYNEKKIVAKELKWTDQLADKLHRPVVKRFRKRIVVAHGIDNIWAADLVDMQAFAKFNGGVKYLLTVIDVFSKYGWIVPLKSKTGVEVAEYFSANSTKTYVDVLDEMVNDYNNTKHSSIKMTPDDASDKKK